MLRMGNRWPQTPGAHDIPSADVSTAETETYSHASSAKPHRAALALAPPPYTPTPCLDSPPIPRNCTSPAARDTPLPRQPLTFPTASSADYVPDYLSPARLSFSPSGDDDDDDVDDDADDDADENVPLARLLPTPCDAPPAYSSVVRHSYRHVPRCSPAEVDEEAALESIFADELAFEVERAVAMAVVMALMMLAGVLVGLLFLRKGA
ncbi:hypothetical protein G6514_004413 [Epicoccum nigrum]|nr:hypothetical protein G6514_004413 [Epicoccum nigrum]